MSILHSKLDDTDYGMYSNECDYYFTEEIEVKYTDSDTGEKIITMAKRTPRHDYPSYGWEGYGHGGMVEWDFLAFVAVVKTEDGNHYLTYADAEDMDKYGDDYEKMAKDALKENGVTQPFKLIFKNRAFYQGV